MSFSADDKVKCYGYSYLSKIFYEGDIGIVHDADENTHRVLVEIDGKLTEFHEEQLDTVETDEDIKNRD